MTGRTVKEFRTHSDFRKLTYKGIGSHRAARRTTLSCGPGQSIYNKQLFSDWTFEELKAYAGKLGIDHGFDENLASTESRRQQLIHAIEARNAAIAR